MYDELIRSLRNEIKYALPSQTRKALIEAADAIEELSRQNKKWEEAVKTALDFIPCWVPVTERLPEDGSDILAFESYCGYERIIPANYDGGVWFDCVFDRVAEHITHWMPLPELPKDGES